MMKIAVIDGQGGGIGKSIIRSLRKTIGDDIEIFALGTNYGATSAMLKEGANKGASGENAIKVTCQNVDIIVGPVGIIVANSMLGEITEVIAKGISDSSAKKVLIPINMCNVIVAGTESYKLSQLVDMAIEKISDELDE